MEVILRSSWQRWRRRGQIVRHTAIYISSALCREESLSQLPAGGSTESLPQEKWGESGGLLLIFFPISFLDSGTEGGERLWLDHVHNQPMSLCKEDGCIGILTFSNSHWSLCMYNGSHSLPCKEQRSVVMGSMGMGQPCRMGGMLTIFSYPYPGVLLLDLTSTCNSHKDLTPSLPTGRYVL